MTVTIAQPVGIMLICLCITSVMMLAVWIVALKLRNAGIVDVAWASGFVILALFCAATAEGWIARRILIALMVIIWSLRLGSYLTMRFLKFWPEEDPRYREFKEAAGSSPNLALLIVFLWQGLVMTLMMAPSAVASQNAEPSILPLETAGLLIWLAGLIGESIADMQLQNFRTKPENRGKTCMEGLWNYSRHPNYFFEWIIWVGLFVFASATPAGLFTIYVPIMMLHLLINVTGVKPSEAHSLKSRGDEYRKYQQTTSMFVPWFKRKSV